MSLTYELDLVILPFDLHHEIQVRTCVCLAMRVVTDRQTDTQCQNYYTRHVTDVGCKNCQYRTSSGRTALSKHLLFITRCSQLMPPVDFLELLMTNADQCWSMLINADQCWSMLFNADQCWSMPINADQCRSMPISANQCWSMPNNTDQFRSMPINVDQCRSIQINADQYWSMLINADQCRSMLINADQCRSMPINADQFWSMLIYAQQYWSIPINAHQCRLIPINADQYWSMLINCSIIIPDSIQLRDQLFYVAHLPHFGKSAMLLLILYYACLNTHHCQSLKGYKTRKLSSSWPQSVTTTSIYCLESIWR